MTVHFLQDELRYSLTLMNLPLMLFDLIGRNMPAAVIAFVRLVKAGGTVKRAAVKELLQPGTVFNV